MNESEISTSEKTEATAKQNSVQSNENGRKKSTNDRISASFSYSLLKLFVQKWTDSIPFV